MSPGWQWQPADRERLVFLWFKVEMQVLRFNRTDVQQDFIVFWLAIIALNTDLRTYSSVWIDPNDAYMYIVHL